MGKKILYIIFTLVTLIAVWVLIPEHVAKPENKKIKKKTEFHVLTFLGKRILNVDKIETYYNKRGAITQSLIYHNDIVIDKYVYTYNELDSLTREANLTGNNLSLYKFDTIIYNKLNKPVNKLEYAIKKENSKTDTILKTKTTYYYDRVNMLSTKIVEQYDKKYKAPDYLQSYPVISGKFIYRYLYNKSGQLLTDTSIIIFGEDVGKNDTTITTYSYNTRGFLKTKLSKDSLYFKTNNKGQLLERVLKGKDYQRTEEKCWYDSKGNMIKQFLAIDDGFEYNYKYDIYNHLVSEQWPGTSFLILSRCVVYKYEYF